MQDVIFQGSDSRKALNVAEVTLVMDNSDHGLPLDYHEVSITRRVYRSGESEFYINKQSCRLKDIVDLFMDSGLGREAFSIISQGKVEEILSSKADERRVIFEEAAGVLKYKQRKRQAEFKLNETRDNLNRVEDIIHEIEQQINPLQEQADKAQRYLTCKKELDDKEVSLLVTEIESFNETWQILLKKTDALKHEEVALSTAIQKREAELEKEQSAISEKDTQIDRLQDDLITLTQKLEQYEGKKQVLQERLKHFTENKSKLEKDKAYSVKQVHELAETVQKEQAYLEQLQQDQHSKQKRIENIKQMLETGEEEIAEQIEDAKSEYIEYLNEQAAIRNEKQSLAKQKEQLQQKQTARTERYDILLSEKETLSKELEAAKQAYEAKEAELSQKEKRLQKLKKSVITYRNDFQVSQDKLYKGYQMLEKLRSQKDMLEGMKEDFQGFFYGVKSILKARDEKAITNIEGAVIELIDVPASYVTAIETVLGAQAQHIVVKDDHAARNAISWLKRTNNGRATFLPLASIQPRNIPAQLIESVQSHKGFIGVAKDLINVPKAYQRAIDHLMGHVVIASNLSDANEIAGQLKRKFRVVTLDGDVVNPGGSMSGGAKKKTNQSLFTRDKELNDISHKLDDYESRTVDFKKKVEKEQKRIQETETEIQELEDMLSHEQVARSELETRFRELKMKRDTSRDQVSLFEQDQHQFTNEVNDLDERETKLSMKLTDIQTELEHLQTNIDQLTKDKDEIEQNRQQLQQELQNHQVDYAEQAARIDSQKDKVETLHAQLSEAQSELKEHTEALEELLELKEAETTEADMAETIAALQSDKETLTNRIKEERSDRFRRSQNVQTEERELKEEHKKHQALSQQLQETEVKANRLDVELETRLNLLQTEYTMTYEKAKNTYSKTDDVEQAKQEVQELKQAIDQLGMVNLGAIDEYERISERYTFLTEQRDDLLEAKDTLYQVISEMDEEMISRFDTTFSQIKAQFSTVFTELFGGGYAELKLTSPDNLLDTGVEIIAQPPGKKLQHLGLLSGGERALTAIALLFSILRVRPVPFCILDEVEAALDEANVTRFAKYIKHFSADTQFIVITHRKGTMEEADVLYGITMQESGVSRLVSVRLEDTKELVNS
ncbi:Chromosome partition protein Smc [Lentibacillus sp. JNUCC-1]|nr:Chromosome partition protein Smc [Lentibacillus sp. JNUCC-1]